MEDLARFIAPHIHLGIIFEVALFFFAIALAVAANYLVRPDDKNQVKDDNPTSVATRGSYVPLLIGRARIGYVFAWAGDRSTKSEKVSGGGKKGGGDDPEIDIYYERGVHWLCVGPAFRLWRINQAGKAIFNGPIDNQSHPSGSTIDLGKEGQFRIYWGETDQPVDSVAGDGTKIGAASRWPFMCYVVWDKKRLGATPNWNLLDYEIETRPFDPQIGASIPFFSTRTLGADSYNIDVVTSGVIGTGYFEITGASGGDRALSNLLKPGTTIQLTPGNIKMPAGDYPVFKSVFTKSPKRVRVYLDVPIQFSEATPTGTFKIYSNDDTEGVNPVFCLEQLMFETFPHGIGILDRLEAFSQASLEAAALQLQTEDLRGRVYVKDGDSAAGAIGSICQEMGATFALHDDGRYRLQLVRKPTGTLPNLTTSVIRPPLPEIESLVEERPVDRAIYLFVDAARNFRDSSIHIDDDGQASYVDSNRSRTIRLNLPTTFDAAVQIAERRSQEELSGGARYRIFATREARRLRPGDAFTASILPDVMRAVGVGLDPYTSRVEIECMTDVFGVDASSFQNSDDGSGEVPQHDVEEDLYVDIAEVPPQLLGGLLQDRVIVPRIRANDGIVRATIWISQDDVTYDPVGVERAVVSGGTLNANFAADEYLDSGATGGRRWVLEYGPQFTIAGDDIGLVDDLTGDELNWWLGRQIAIINDEIFFVRNVAVIDAPNGIYQLRGLVRARYDTARQSHSSGDPVFILDPSAVFSFQDLAIGPGRLIYIKAQPEAANSLDLDEVTAVSKTLIGKGSVPMSPGSLRSTNTRRSWTASGNLLLIWNYRTSRPNTGAGFIPAGDAYFDDTIEGTFTLNFYTSADVFKGSLTGITTNSRTVTAAEITALFGTEPTSMKVTVLNVVGAYSSVESPKVLFTRE